MMVSLDAVLINGRCRICYAGTELPALVAENSPVDMFETVLEQKAAEEGRRVWILQRRSSGKPPGFVNGGQANRCIQMLAEAKIEIVPLEE